MLANDKPDTRTPNNKCLDEIIEQNEEIIEQNKAILVELKSFNKNLAVVGQALIKMMEQPMHTKYIEKKSKKSS